MTIQFNDISKEAIGIQHPDSQFFTLTPTSFYSMFGKRCLDILLIVGTACLTVPVILIIALAISLDGHKPFFRQKRVGKGNKEFYMWKLRSMVASAEEQLQAHLDVDPKAKLEWETTQKLKQDPRITFIGRFIRKTSLDELPQLWNVLRGEMSLIGPRPMLCEQRELYPGNAYYSLRPGISGFWQISDRNESEFKSRALFDLKYLQAVSLKTDVLVIFRTVGAVLRCTGY